MGSLCNCNAKLNSGCVWHESVVEAVHTALTLVSQCRLVVRSPVLFRDVLVRDLEDAGGIKTVHVVLIWALCCESEVFDESSDIPCHRNISGFRLGKIEIHKAVPWRCNEHTTSPLRLILKVRSRTPHNAG